MEFGIMYYIVVISGAFTLSYAIMKGVEYLDNPKPNRRSKARSKGFRARFENDKLVA